ncbi:MAG: hypothetical protein ACK4G3_04325 [bacterium]
MLVFFGIIFREEYMGREVLPSLLRAGVVVGGMVLSALLAQTVIRLKDPNFSLLEIFFVPNWLGSLMVSLFFLFLVQLLYIPMYFPFFLLVFGMMGAIFLIGVTSSAFFALLFTGLIYGALFFIRGGFGTFRSPHSQGLVGLFLVLLFCIVFFVVLFFLYLPETSWSLPLPGARKRFFPKRMIFPPPLREESLRRYQTEKLLRTGTEEEVEKHFENWWKRIEKMSDDESEIEKKIFYHYLEIWSRRKKS